MSVVDAKFVSAERAVMYDGVDESRALIGPLPRTHEMSRADGSTLSTHRGQGCNARRRPRQGRGLPHHSPVALMTTPLLGAKPAPTGHRGQSVRSDFLLEGYGR